MALSTYIVFLAAFLFIGNARSFDAKNNDQPPDPDLMFCANIGIAIQQCAITTNFPYCNGTKSELQQCTEKYLPDLDKCKVSVIANVLKEIAKSYTVTDDALCKNNLYKQFENDTVCWGLAKSQLIALTRLTSGVFTKTGCSIAKMNVDIIIGFGYEHKGCQDKLKAFLYPVFAKSVCASAIKHHNQI